MQGTLLSDALQRAIDDNNAGLAGVLNQYGSVELPMTFKQVAAGLHGAPALMSALPRWSSFVDPEKGLHIAARPIEEVAHDPFEANILRLLLGRDPEDAEVLELQQELEARMMSFPSCGAYQGVVGMPTLFDRLADPMTMLAAQLNVVSSFSRMSTKTREGRTNELDWQTRLEDMLDVLAMLLVAGPLCARRVCEHPAMVEIKWHGSFAKTFVCMTEPHIQDEEANFRADVLNVLLNLMIYHGAGNVSTYTALVAHSGGNDMYQAAAAMCNGLSGFNHGGAAYQGLRFILGDLNIENCSDREALRAIAKERIRLGLSIWCVGHRILRGSNDDPRAAVAKKLIEEIASRHKHGQVLLRRANTWYEVAVEEIVLAKPGIGFQAVNIDGYTGLLAYLAGLIPEKDAASIAGLFFAVSRTAGALTECFWSGVNGKVPLIRPSVVTMELLTRLAQEA